MVFVANTTNDAMWSFWIIGIVAHVMPSSKNSGSNLKKGEGAWLR